MIERRNSNIYKNCYPQEVYDLSIDVHKEMYETYNNNSFIVKQTDHGFNIGNVLYVKSTGKYDKAVAENSERIEAVGIVTTVINKNNFIITTSGKFETSVYNNFVDGIPLYLSDDVNKSGQLISMPTTYIKPIGIKIKNGILINIQRANEIDNS
jgi:hypothetical protein